MRIEIDVGNITFDDDQCALIICAHTGIFYTAQCGGMGCDHPFAEGFFLPVFDVAPKIDDCLMGCCALTKSPGFNKPELRKLLADTIDSSLREIEKKYSFSMRFDYERIDEMMEGWWPLLIFGTLHGVSGLNHRCYLHRGNCD